MRSRSGAAPRDIQIAAGTNNGTQRNDDQTHAKGLQRGRFGPARSCRLGPPELATTLGTWLGTRSLRRLFLFHSAVLPGLAAVSRYWGSTHSIRNGVGGLAGFHPGSLDQY